MCFFVVVSMQTVKYLASLSKNRTCKMSNACGWFGVLRRFAQELQVSLKYTTFSTTTVLLPHKKQGTTASHFANVSHRIAELVFGPSGLAPSLDRRPGRSLLPLQRGESVSYVALTLG